MKTIRLNSECIECMLAKYMKQIPENTKEEQKVEYMQAVLKIMAEAPMSAGAPELVDAISAVQQRILGYKEDYTEIKRYFNALMLDFEEGLYEKLKCSDDPLRLAVCYAMTGNYIDFGAVKNVEAEKLRELLDKADDISPDETELNLLKNDLKNAERLVFLTDNCGEVVLDKVLLNVIRNEYPHLEIDVIVRGEPVINDATMEDAQQIGLTEEFNVSDNGNSVAGTCLEKVSLEAREKIDNADVIIAKGQGNFETLRGCEKNVYYLFMCKCKMFAKRFGVPQFSGMLLNDCRLSDV